MTLAARLRARIEAGGPIPFAEFMEAALLDPEDGFYARGRRLGVGGAFSTAATRLPAFARAVAAEVRACHAELGAEGAFAIVEAGAGDGSLAAALAPLGHELVLVEPAEGMRRLQSAALAGAAAVRWAATPEEVRVDVGLVVANELFDDLPVHLVEPPDELLVDVGPDGRFREARRRADPALLALVPESRPGGRYAVRPQAPLLLARLVATIARGRLLAIDYGGEGAEAHRGRDPVRTYFGGARGGSPLDAPGTQNLTADVDFGQLRRAARDLGLEELRYEPQPDWLRRHGARVPPPELRTDEDWLLASLLAAPEFKVLLLEKPEPG